MNREGEVEDEGKEGSGRAPEGAGRAGTQNLSGEIRGRPFSRRRSREEGAGSLVEGEAGH